MIFTAILLTVVAVGIYRIAVLVVARISPTHTVSVTDGLEGELSFRCGRQGGIFFVSWPFGTVVLTDRELVLRAPVDLGVPESADLSDDRVIAVRRALYFTFIKLDTTPDFDESGPRTFWLARPDAERLLALIGARPLNAEQN